jgi:hypothetical protein
LLLQCGKEGREVGGVITRRRVAADTGRLKTEIDPRGAGVFIDGKFVGPAANFKIARTYELSPVNTRSDWPNPDTRRS